MIVKYSIGGPITSVVEADEVQEKEPIIIPEQLNKLAVCNECGIQHLVTDKRTYKCACGNIIRFN